MRKTFNLAAALSEEPIEYRGDSPYIFQYMTKLDGKPCLFCHNIVNSLDIHVDLNGRVLHCIDGKDNRVFMAAKKVKKTIWVNLYPDITYECGFRPGAFSKKEEADSWYDKRIGEAHPLEIEVEE